MIFTLVWLLGTLASLAFFGYMKGHADARFRDNRGLTENPPFIIGMLTSPFWPAQVFAGLIWAICHYTMAAGKGGGLALNTEVASLRKFAADYQRQEARTFALLMDNNVDPGSIDDQTKRALTARSIEWAMTDEAQIKREAAGLPAVRTTKPSPVPRNVTDDMFEILDRQNVPVKSDLYSDYRSRTNGHLDLS